MDENKESLQVAKNSASDYGKQVEAFFAKMDYTPKQKALFYLGRVLNQVAYAQFKKNHKNKPVLNKINYNGMDSDDILRLRVDLAEKARQYNIVNETDFNFARFTEMYNPNDKHLSPNENVFFILSGYSFGISKKETQDPNESGEENEQE